MSSADMCPPVMFYSKVTVCNLLFNGALVHVEEPTRHVKLGQKHHYVKIYHSNINNYLFKALTVVKHGIINPALTIFRFLQRCC